MILSYNDFFGEIEGGRKNIHAKITTDYPTSSDGQPVIVLPGGRALEYIVAILFDYKPVSMSEEK